MKEVRSGDENRPALLREGGGREEGASRSSGLGWEMGRHLGLAPGKETSR